MKQLFGHCVGGPDRFVLGSDRVRSSRQRARVLRRARQRAHAKSTQSSDTQSRLVRPHPLPLHATVQSHEGKMKFLMK